jgi:tetratricopeptide (TPR) repeat protein
MKKILLTLIISLFCFNLYSQSANELFNQSIKYANANDLKKAEKITKELIKNYPNDEDIHLYWNNLGAFQSNQGNNKEALKSFSKSFELNDKYGVALLNRAKTYRDLEQFDNAIIDYKNVIKLDTNNEEALFDLAMLLSKREDYANAQVYYEKLIASNPEENYPAAINLVIVKKRQGDLDGALSDMNKLIEKIPSNEFLYENRANVYNNRADILMNMKRYDEAFVDIEKSLALEPDYVTAIITKGEIYYFKGDYGNACIFFKIAQSKGAPKEKLDKYMKNCK